jgi:hypothetical protein
MDLSVLALSIVKQGDNEIPVRVPSHLFPISIYCN